MDEGFRPEDWGVSPDPRSFFAETITDMKPMRVKLEALAMLISPENFHTRAPIGYP
jgi:hypothetical protein